MSPPPGWFPDPADPARLRWWDGRGWSRHTRSPTPDPSPRLAAPPPSAADAGAPSRTRSAPRLPARPATTPTPAAAPAAPAATVTVQAPPASTPVPPQPVPVDPGAAAPSTPAPAPVPARTVDPDPAPQPTPQPAAAGPGREPVDQQPDPPPPATADSDPPRWWVAPAVVAGTAVGLGWTWWAWQRSWLLVAVPVALVAVWRLRGRRRATRVDDDYQALLAVADSKGLTQGLLWSAPATWIPGPDDPAFPPRTGMVAVYGRGIAWFPGPTAAAAGTGWWKTTFTDVSLVHRTFSATLGTGMDVHTFDGAVRCLQVPTGFAADMLPALTSVHYPVLDN